MANIRKLLVVFLSSAFLSTKIIVHGSRETYPTNASVNLTEEMSNSGAVFSRNETWSIDSRILGYPCDSKTCLSLCCPLEKAWLSGSCVEDNTTSRVSLRSSKPMHKDEVKNYDLDHDLQLVIDDPCGFNWMASSVLEDFYVLSNGTIYAPDSEAGTHSDLEHYCLFREPKSAVYLARVCSPWIRPVYWHIFCLVFAALLMVAILIVYSVVPELGNLHGMVFRAYIAAYIGCHLGTIGQQCASNSRKYADLFNFFIFSLHYFAGCCALWLNVMSFNIWRTFRSLRSVDNHNRVRERKKFIWYAIYACVTPALMNITTAALMHYVPYFQKLPLNSNIITWSCAGLLTTVVICNTFFFISTALRISRHEKDTAHLENGVNKHHDVDKQWFNLHVKLFLVTGCHTMMWVVWELWPTPVTTSLMIVLELVQTILIFVIFVCKGNVIRSIRKRFEATLIVSRLQDTFGTNNSTPKTGS